MTLNDVKEKYKTASVVRNVNGTVFQFKKPLELDVCDIKNHVFAKSITGGWNILVFAYKQTINQDGYKLHFSEILL